jgi:hypothetical protein
MATTHPDFTSILLRRGTINAEQLEEARAVGQRTGKPLEQTLIELGHATPRQIAEAVAEAHGLPFLDLDGLIVAPAVIELIPESVGRENGVLPLGSDGKTIWVVVADPDDRDTLQKLEFILNKNVRPVVGIREQIVATIDRHYGETETESVDSMLAEFTDTAIDFTETGAASSIVLDSVEEDYGLGDSHPTDLGTSAYRADVVRRRKKSPFVERQATVRYYQRMNPERLFPLLVVLSRKAVEEVAKRGVSQARSGRFRAEADAPVEIEPVLPGCHCYPPRKQVAVLRETVTVTFWVVPHVLGKVQNARVLVRQEGRLLAEVPLEPCVGKQTLTVLLGALSLVLPFALLLLKHFHLDFESQLDQGFGLYAQVADWELRALSPELVGGVLLAAAAAAYLWLRPRRKDVFWDVRTGEPNGAHPRDGTVHGPRNDGDAEDGEVRNPGTFAEHQALLLAQAEAHYRREEYASAQRYYDSALALGPAGALVYHHASLAAHLAGNTARALAILLEAGAELGDAGMRGAMWYNLGCFATRLGQFDDALHYLSRAADRGCTDPEKYRSDPDLAPLRWSAEFRRFLRSLAAFPTRAGQS